MATRTAPKKRFVPAEGSRLKADEAEVVGKRIEELERKHGPVTPEHVLADAKAKSSPLHRFFEWHDDRAAEAHRLDQARYLLRSVRLVIEEETKTSKPIRVRAFVVVNENTKDQGYVGLDTAMNDDAHRLEVLRRALAELEQWGNRYRAFKECADGVRAAESLRKQLKLEGVAA